MLHGKVKWFDSSKGYGFITEDNGDEYFVHYSGISQGRVMDRPESEDGKVYLTLQQNDEVEFDFFEAEKGRQAVSVVVVKEAPPVQRKPRNNNNNKKKK